MRYPLAPLLDAYGGTHRAVAAVLGLKIAAIRQAAHRGLSEAKADQWAVALGFHPCVIWPDWGDHNTVVCAAADCTTSFDPGGYRHRRYCSTRCRNREKARRYRATARGAETNRRHRRAYYDTCGDYENARRRAQRRAA